MLGIVKGNYGWTKGFYWGTGMPDKVQVTS